MMFGARTLDFDGFCNLVTIDGWRVRFAAQDGAWRIIQSAPVAPSFTMGRVAAVKVSKAEQRNAERMAAALLECVMIGLRSGDCQPLALTHSGN